VIRWICVTLREVVSLRAWMGEADTAAAAAAARAMGALKCMLMIDAVREIDDACVDVL
jgi:hypothetical protein